MAMSIVDQFDLKAQKFNFSRDYFESEDLLNAAPKTNFPNHFITNVAGTLYQLTKTETTSDGKIDESKGTWKKLEFGDKNALTASGDDNTISQNGTNLSKIQLNDGVNKVTIDTTYGINVNSFGTGQTEGVTLTNTGLKFDDDSGKNTEVWTTDGGKVDISGLPSEGAVSAIQAKLEGIDDTVVSYVNDKVAGLSQALVFKGSIDSNDALLALTPKIGDTYVVGTAGEFAGETCEVGDTLVCPAAKNGDTAATWIVVQRNIDGAVINGEPEKNWEGALMVGAAGNQVVGITGTEGQIVIADADGHATFGSAAAVEAAQKAAEAAQATATEAKTTADTNANEITQIKADLDNKASTDVATETTNGLMSAEDKKKLGSLQNFTLTAATADSLGGVMIPANSGLAIQEDGSLSLEQKTTAVAKGLYKISVDAFGRVASTDTVSVETDLGISSLTTDEVVKAFNGDTEKQ